jgi:hypothetical protein
VSEEVLLGLEEPEEREDAEEALEAEEAEEAEDVEEAELLVEEALEAEEAEEAEDVEEAELLVEEALEAEEAEEALELFELLLLFCEFEPAEFALEAAEVLQMRTSPEHIFPTQEHGPTANPDPGSGHIDGSHIPLGMHELYGTPWGWMEGTPLHSASVLHWPQVKFCVQKYCPQHPSGITGLLAEELQQRRPQPIPWPLQEPLDSSGEQLGRDMPADRILSHVIGSGSICVCPERGPRGKRLLSWKKTVTNAGMVTRSNRRETSSARWSGLTHGSVSEQSDFSAYFFPMFQDFPFLAADLLRDLNHEFGVVIAKARCAKDRESLALDPEEVPRLHAGINGHTDFPMYRGHRNLSAEERKKERELHMRMNIVTFAPKPQRKLHANGDIEIAGRRTACTRTTLATDA